MLTPDLIARIEAAQPSEARELFEEAWRAVHGGDPQWCQYYSEDIELRHGARSYSNKLQAEAYLDAAAMFLPERVGHWPQVCTISTNPNNPSSQKERVEIWMKNGGRPFRGHATTPYFALLAAAMKARQTDERD